MEVSQAEEARAASGVVMNTKVIADVRVRLQNTIAWNIAQAEVEESFGRFVDAQHYRSNAIELQRQLDVMRDERIKQTASK